LLHRPMIRLSLKQRFRNWRERLLAPETDWIQVEVSSHCNASCAYCPHTVYHDIWVNRHLSLPAFRRLLPAIANTDLLFLQGWGEPFLNPYIFSMIALAKKTGCRVGTTTNGMLLDDKKIKRLIKCGIDIISFSIAGLNDGNDTSRRGTRLKTVLDVIRNINQMKINHGLTKPAIHISYLLLRSALKDLMRIPDVLSDMGINQVVISTLDFVPTRQFENETLCPVNAVEFKELHSVLDEVKKLAKDKGLHVHYNLGRADRPQRICSENPQRSFYVSSDGTVSPCVFTNLPVSDISYVFRGRMLPYKRLAFGNIKNNSISAIWRQKEYAEFRRSFDTGQLNSVCGNCHKLYII